MSTPESSESADLLRRVERLEARLGSTLEVSRLRVLGARGKPVIELGASPDGEPEIVLLDALGRDRILLRLVEDEAALEMLAEDGTPQLRAAASENAARVVTWSRSEPARRAELRVASDGTAVFAVLEGREDIRAIFGVNAAGDGVLRCDPPARTESAS